VRLGYRALALEAGGGRMNRERISYDKRFALWRAHAGRCPYCGLPVRFLDMQIDHILPERLMSDPQQLARLKSEYVLEETFDLHDYGNWLPTHAGCNSRKGAIVPDRNVALSWISLATGKAAQARAEEERYTRTLAADQVVGKLLAAVKRGRLTKEAVLAAVAMAPEPVRPAFDPIVVCFGLSVEEVLERGALPRHVSTDYPSLCDWLEVDLLQRLRSALKSDFFYPEPSARNGETLSVRLALIGPQLDALSCTDWGGTS